jgi:hypothetical protein
MKNKKALKSLLFLSLFSVIMSFNSCKSKNENGFEEISIDVDKNRIGNEFVEMNLKFKFNPPKAWLLKPSELTEKIVSRQNAIKESGDSFLYKPLYVFFSDSTKGILTIGTIDTNDSLKSPVQIQRYLDEIVARHGKENVVIKNYVKDKIMISQLTITKQSIVSEKMVFRNSEGRYLQLDYTMQKGDIEKEEKAIESSLGTLKLFK